MINISYRITCYPSIENINWFVNIKDMSKAIEIKSYLKTRYPDISFEINQNDSIKS